jgi:hypothetical protein
MVHQSRDELELMDLLSSAWDRHLTPELRDRLEELLSRGDCDGVKLLTDFTRLHLDLEWFVSSNDAQAKALKAIARLKSGGSDRPTHQRSLLKPILAIAAGLLFALVGHWFYSTPRSNQPAQLARDEQSLPAMRRPRLPVGRLFRQNRARWADGNQFQDGQTLFEGQVIDLVEGMGQISLDFGAELVVEAPSRLTLVADNLVTLESGRIMVRAANWAKGFKVRTNDLLATDLGTQFVVSADANMGSEVHVLEGLVIAGSIKQPSLEHRTSANRAVRVNLDGVLESIAFRRDDIAGWLDQIAPLRPVRIANTGVGLKVGEKDPRWLITTGDRQFAPYPQPATVCLPDHKHGENDPASSQWISVKEGTTAGVPVRTKHTFATRFDLTGIHPSSVRLTALVAADNGVEAVWLNDKRLAISPWQDWYPGAAFYQFYKVEIADGFVPGNNTLAITVNNQTQLTTVDGNYHENQEPNPMALRVEWVASGRSR